jgi:serine/threonine protein kinase
MIDQLEIMDAFVDNQISDKSFPFEQKTLPKDLSDPSARSAFLHAQTKVLSKGYDLVKTNGKHRHFADASHVPLQTVAELGKGAFGHVDMVISTISNDQYARKRILRGRTPLRDRRVLEDLETELQILKKLSHRHIVTLIGSYTDPKYVCLVTWNEFKMIRTDVEQLCRYHHASSCRL